MKPPLPRSQGEIRGRDRILRNPDRVRRISEMGTWTKAELRLFDKRRWMTTDEDLEYIGDKLNITMHIPVLTRTMIRRLNLADQDLVKGGLLGAKPEGLFKPRPSTGK